MTFTSHGHHIAGTTYDQTNRPQIARCGGPAICDICGKELARHLEMAVATQRQKETKMQFKEFVRKPFTVEAVEVTVENIDEIAKFVGTLSHKQDGTPFIQVDRRLIPNVFRVFPGFWMTKMNDNIRCYSRRVFTEQFTDMTPDIKQWVDFMNDEQDDESETPASPEQENADDNGGPKSDAGIV